MLHQEYVIVSKWRWNIVNETVSYLIHSLIFFSFAGYETAHDILNMEDSDINHLESFATTIPQIIKSVVNLLNVKLTAACERRLLHLFLGILATDSGNFKFKLGEISLIKGIIQFGRMQLEKNNESYDIFEQHVGQTKTTVNTPIGEFFGNEYYWPNLYETTNATNISKFFSC